MSRATDLIDRFKRMEARQSEWMEWWQSLAEVFMPHQAEFTSRHTAGKRRNFKNYENSHRVAARNFAAVLGSFIGPQSEEQLTIVVDDEELSERDDVRLWQDTVRSRMWRSMGRTSARYSQAKSETDRALVVFGTGALFIGENERRDGLLFRAHHLREVAVGTNAAGDVERLGFRRKLTARQAAEEYGENNLGQKTRDILNRGTGQQQEQKLAFVHMILPREDFDARLIGPRGMAWASVVLDIESEHIVRESGYHEFPFAVPRWETSPDEVYGRSPAMLAYADSKTLQAIARTMLLGGQRAVDPPTWILNDAAVSPVRTYPGGTTVIDAQSAQATGGRPPIGILELGANVPIGREMQEDYRMLVQASFYRDLFASAVESPQRTATEILERKEEMVRILGPTFGRLEEDYIGRIVSRVFHIMERAGAFPERPEALEGADVQFAYHSPFQLARRSSEAVGISRAIEMLSPVAQLKPEILDHFDEDQIARDTPGWFGFAEKYIRREDVVAQLRQAREQAIAMQQAAQLGEQSSKAVENIARADNLMSETVGE